MVWGGGGGGGSMQALLLGEVITHNFGITVYCTYLQIPELLCMLWFNSILGLKFHFLLFKNHYRILPYQKPKEEKI